MFVDRRDAGRQLAEIVARLDLVDPIVVGLPRGGVPVAREVADRLGAPLDVVLVRKIGVPNHPELAMGAVGEGDVRVVSREVVTGAGVSDVAFAAAEGRARSELAEQAARFRDGRQRLEFSERTVIVVDDGVATGATARVACEFVRLGGARSIVLAAPVAPSDWLERLGDVADELIAVETPRDFQAVGAHYRDFSATTEQEVIAALERAPRPHRSPDGTS